MPDQIKKATREAYGEALVELGKERDDIYVLDGDLSASTMTAMFKKAYPDRFFNAGIAEQNLIAVAAGLSETGKTVFASTFAVFATGRAYDQVRQNVAYNNANVKIAATHAGLTVGEDGASHQALEDVALMRVLPNMRVVVPGDAVEAFQVVKMAAATPGPFYIRLGRAAVPVVFDNTYRFQLGKAVVLKDGHDVAIMAAGYMVGQALIAADMLAQDGVSACIINVSTIKPLDVSGIVAIAKKCGAVVTAEEHSIIGGLGSAVAEALGENYPCPMIRVGVKDVFGQSGTPADLIAAYGLNPEDVKRAALDVIRRK